MSSNLEGKIMLTLLQKKISVNNVCLRKLLLFGEFLRTFGESFWNFINSMSFLMHPESVMISIETLLTTTTSLGEMFKCLDRSSPVITI